MNQDYADTLERCATAAELGEAQAQFQLGLMYGLGLGVKQNYATALSWYREAARQGHGKAQINLGYMFGTGRGVPQDYVEAYAWYSIAAAAGDEIARANRDIVASEMSANQLEEAQNLSKDLFASIHKGEPTNRQTGK